jgi:transposase
VKQEPKFNLNAILLISQLEQLNNCTMLDTNISKIIDFTGQNFYVGLDVHKKSWYVTVRSLDMEVARFTQPPSPDALVKTLKEKFPGGDYYSAYEAGFCGTSYHEQLCHLGIKNIIVHPADVPITDKQKKNKTDLHDSRNIAQQLEKKTMHGIHIMPREQQELRSLFRLRESRVKDVTRSNNRLKGFMMYFGIQVPPSLKKKEYLSKRILEWLSALELSTEAGRLSKEELIKELKHQREQEFKITKQLRIYVQTFFADDYKHLLSVPGIGSITAIALLSEIGNFSRFDDPDQYISYLGITPWNDSTGEDLRTKGIQPRCNKHLRPLLIEASWTAIRTAPELFAYYSKHAVKDNKHAIVKVARRLALIAKGVVLNKEDYQADYLQKKLKEKIAKKGLRQTKNQFSKNKKVFEASTEKHMNK